MPIDVPTRDEVREQGLEALASVEANVDTSPDTLAGALLTAGADFCGGVHVNVDSSSKDIHATSAMDDTVLEKHAEIRLGTNPWKAATKSSGTDALRVTGTHASAEVTPSDTLEHDNGNRYVHTESVVVGVGTADISVRASTRAPPPSSLPVL